MNNFKGNRYVPTFEPPEPLEDSSGSKKPVALPDVKNLRPNQPLLKILRIEEPMDSARGSLDKLMLKNTNVFEKNPEIERSQKKEPSVVKKFVPKPIVVPYQEKKLEVVPKKEDPETPVKTHQNNKSFVVEGNMSDVVFYDNESINDQKSIEVFGTPMGGQRITLPVYETPPSVVNIISLDSNSPPKRCEIPGLISEKKVDLEDHDMEIEIVKKEKMTLPINKRIKKVPRELPKDSSTKWNVGSPRTGHSRTPRTNSSRRISLNSSGPPFRTKSPSSRKAEEPISRNRREMGRRFDVERVDRDDRRYDMEQDRRESYSRTKRDRESSRYSDSYSRFPIKAQIAVNESRTEMEEFLKKNEHVSVNSMGKLHCDVCKTFTTSLFNMKQHVNGKAHREMLRKHESRRSFSKSSVLQKYSTPSPKSYFQRSPKGFLPKFEDIVRRCDFFRTIVKKVSDTPPIFNTRYKCALCGIAHLGSKISDAIAHLHSDDHLKEIDNLMGILYCDEDLFQKIRDLRKRYRGLRDVERMEFHKLVTMNYQIGMVEGLENNRDGWDCEFCKMSIKCDFPVFVHVACRKHVGEISKKYYDD